eukprot:COSAG04_NODE_348_length_16121_cov_7.375172_6_plen_123_part_00
MIGEPFGAESESWSGAGTEPETLLKESRVRQVSEGWSESRCGRPSLEGVKPSLGGLERVLARETKSRRGMRPQFESRAARFSCAVEREAAANVAADPPCALFNFAPWTFGLTKLVVQKDSNI